MNKKKMIRFMISSFIIGLLLFLWSGLTQFIPWGVPTTNTLRSTSIEMKKQNFQAPNLKEFENNHFTTEEFDKEMVNKINTLTTEKTFSWIITKPLSYYDQGRYFIIELINQILIGFLLSAILLLSHKLKFYRRILLILTIGIISTVAIYGRLSNWWGLPMLYAIGESINLILGWLLAGFISAKFIIKNSL
ncbi:MAG: hypothetical protein ACOCVF_04290 [bacterium]